MNTLNNNLPNFLNGAAMGYVVGCALSRFHPFFAQNLVTSTVCNGISQAFIKTNEPYPFLPEKINVKITPARVVAELVNAYALATFASFIPWSVNPVALTASITLAGAYAMIKIDPKAYSAETEEQKKESLTERLNALSVALSIGILAYPIIMHTAPHAVLHPVLTMTRAAGVLAASFIVSGLTAKKTEAQG